MSRRRDPRHAANRARAAALRQTPARAAAKLRKAAQKYFLDGKKLFRNDPRGLDLVTSDYFSLRFIASQIKAGNFASAYRNAGRLDTLVRDVIPMDVWVFIGGTLAH